MAKPSALDRAIDNLKQDIAVLQLALAKLEAQRQPAKPPRVRKAKAQPDMQDGSR